MPRLALMLLLSLAAAVVQANEQIEPGSSHRTWSATKEAFGFISAIYWRQVAMRVR